MRLLSEIRARRAGSQPHKSKSTTKSTKLPLLKGEKEQGGDVPTLVFIDSEGKETRADAKNGSSAMIAALNAGLTEIEADCGGSCMCATCHVYVDPAWADKLPKIQVMEEDMLGETASERRPFSRLSCQIEITDDLDGLVLHLPETQS